MSVNFALDIIGTTVSSDKVSLDGHEARNLISQDTRLRQKGFITEPFIKPPVNITFTFPCGVYISHILVTPCVGQQQSSQLEVFSAARPTPKTAHGKKTAMRHYQAKTEDLSSTESAHQRYSKSQESVPIFYPVSRKDTLSPNSICFYNPLFRTSGHNVASFTEKSELRHFRKDLLNCSSHLVIRILRTLHGSTPALCNVEIWGLPSSSVCADIKKELLDKFHKFTKPSRHISISAGEKREGKSGSTENMPVVCSEAKELEIPEDFIDPLTCEVMTIPMILPSGKNVDKSTLDRFVDTEASYGRQPRDPFTGVLFSSSSQPVPNGVLKTRIDQFLFKHRDNPNTASVPRTVKASDQTTLLGKRKHFPDKGRVASSLVVSKSREKVKGFECSTSSKVVDNSTRSATTYLLTEKNKCEFSSIASDHGDNSDSFRTPQKKSMSSPINSGAAPSHEVQLKNSLDDALLSLLNSTSGPASSSSAKSCIEQDPDIRCCICEQSISNGSLMYQASCSHVICRNCLTTKLSPGSIICCCLCMSMIRKEDVVRVHSLS